MAGNMSLYLQNLILDHILRGETYTPPSTVYVGLVDDNALDSELNNGDLTNEITSYTGDRKAMTFDSAVQDGTASKSVNNAQVDFEDMPNVNVKYSIICDSATGGNILFWLPAGIVKTIYEGDINRVRVGDIEISMD
jgi:hypothetical protein